MTDVQSLVTITEAKRMLAEMRNLEDVRELRNKAIAAQTYAKEKGLGIQAQNHAGEIVVECQIRGGQLLAEMASGGERRTAGGNGSKTEPFPKLADLGYTKKESANDQTIAAAADKVRAWVSKAKTDTERKRTVITTGRAARIARDAKAREPDPDAPAPVLPATCDLRLGDFRGVLASVSNHSIDVILTDPPYPGEFLPLWSELALFAKRVLKPSGMLVAMSGQTHLPDVYARLGEHLSYRWTMAYLMTGAANVVHARRVSTMWKPVLVYGSSERRLHDVARSDVGEKAHHGWGQSERGMAELLRLVADPGAIICDPFTGGGTTGVVALAYGCSFVGAEIDEAHFQTARRRLAQ